MMIKKTLKCLAVLGFTAVISVALTLLYESMKTIRSIELKERSLEHKIVPDSILYDHNPTHSIRSYVIDYPEGQYRVFTYSSHLFVVRIN